MNYYGQDPFAPPAPPSAPGYYGYSGDQMVGFDAVQYARDLGAQLGDWLSAVPASTQTMQSASAAAQNVSAAALQARATAASAEAHLAKTSDSIQQTSASIDETVTVIKWVAIGVGALGGLYLLVAMARG